MNLTATNRLLTFDGFFKMKSNCNLIKEEWVGFSSEINPKHIKFKLDSELRNDEGDRLVYWNFNEFRFNPYVYIIFEFKGKTN